MTSLVDRPYCLRPCQPTCACIVWPNLVFRIEPCRRRSRDRAFWTFGAAKSAKKAEADFGTNTDEALLIGVENFSSAPRGRPKKSIGPRWYCFRCASRFSTPFIGGIICITRNSDTILENYVRRRRPEVIYRLTARRCESEWLL